MTTGPQFIVSYFYFMIYWGDFPKVGRFFSSHFSNPPLISSFTLSTSQPRTDLTQASWPGCHWILRWVRSLGSRLCFLCVQWSRTRPLLILLLFPTSSLWRQRSWQRLASLRKKKRWRFAIRACRLVHPHHPKMQWLKHMAYFYDTLWTACEILTIWHTDVNNDNAQKHVVAPGFMSLCDNIQAHRLTTDFSNTLHTFSPMSVVFNSFWRKQHFMFKFMMLTLASM